jgi:hypothetical protein
VFNADLDDLQGGRGKPEGEIDFLVACTYRLLGLRSLSTGDVVSVITDSDSVWLACDFLGWRRIDAPENRTGSSLTAATVHEHLRRSGRA